MKFDICGFFENRSRKFNLHYNLTRTAGTAELHLSGLIAAASHPDMHKIRMIGFIFENRQQLQFEVWLLLFTECTCV
jgi:hypothetical protein